MTNAERDGLIAQMILQGMSLSDIQKVLLNEHSLKLTYMDLRLISSDLKVSWEKQDAAKAALPTEKDISKIPDPAADEVDGAGGEAMGGGRTKVTVSKLVRPGAMFSGDVTFGSGGRAEWWVDNQGRLGLNPLGDDVKPTQQDIMEFQDELQRLLQGPA